MADIADLAQDHIEREMGAALEARKQAPQDSADCCVECGLEIPGARQIALPGVQTCVDCAEMLERKR